jgi:hypothetical protein
LLEDAKKAAKEQAYFMRKALDNADLRSGLKHASLMLTEFKTSLLSPRNYYILFMAIFDYMRGNLLQIQNYKIILRMILVEEGGWSMCTKPFNMLPKSSRGFISLLLLGVSTFRVMRRAQRKF